MKKTLGLSMFRPVALPLGILCLSLLLGATATDVLAGGSRATGATSDQLMVYNGNREGTDIGDFITACDSGSGCTLAGVTTGFGLNLPYSYFIEVPPGLSRLVVELFDPDILAAADPDDERDEDRDLLRSGLNTYARYRLFDPDGNQVPTAFGVGGDNQDGGLLVSTPNPVAWDNSWVTFYDSDRAGATGTATFIDNFGSAVYSNNDGTSSFATDWSETLDHSDGTATGGNILITGGELSISNVGDPDGSFRSQPRIDRQLDLSSFTNAVVSFDWDTGTGMEDNDVIIFEVSDDGGVNWVGMDILSNFASGAASGSASYDITDFIASNTEVRFRILDNFAGPGEAFFIDNFTISAGNSANGASPAAGHWRIEMDMTTEVRDRDGQQEELNALAIRAHDGDSSSTGTEVNVYALSYFSLGLNNNNRSRSYTMYPYITEGCEIDVNDFDHDADAPDPDGVGGIDTPYGSWDLTSREGFTDDEASVLSDNNSWDSQTVTGFNDDTSAFDYGIWTMDMNISDFGNGNYAVYYIGHEDAAAPAPTGSPEADSARIYFPTDANTAPSKPYATHTVRYEGPGNGPNPPVMGSVTTFALTIRVVNPSGSIGSISFDNAASRTVTAQVPASTGDFELTYRGLPTGFPTSGSIIGQPTIGSTTGGTITWEPADIASGDDAVLVYEFDIEPLVATDPLTIPVSGTYLANGTAISFLDETGDISGAFTLGPLCGLAIIAGPSATETPVLVSNFEARPARGGTLLEWTTAAEAGSASFDIYRHGPGNVRQKVNNQALLALLDAPQGGIYRFIDVGADPEDANTYSLVEHTATGRQIQHGPFTVQVRWDLPQLDVAGGYERTPHPLTSRAVDGGSALAPSQELIAAAGRQVITSGLAANDALWVTTGAAGIYELTAAELATHFGLPEQDLRRLIQTGKVAITHLGQPVPWHQSLDASTLRFHAEANDSIYSDTRAFRVTLENGRRMATIRGDEPSADWQPDAFRDTVRGEENLRPVVLAPLDPASDIWFWDFLRNGDATHGTKGFTFDLPSVADVAATADLTVHLQGVSQGQHTLDVSVNGQFVGSASVNDLDANSVVLPISQALLTSGSNTVQLSATAGDLVFVDAFEVAYDRLYGSQNEALLSRGDGNDRIAVGGFTDPSITVYDLRNDGNPRVLDAVRRTLDGGTFRAIWEPAGPQVPYLAVSDAGVLAPLAVTVDAPSQLRTPENRADHVILAPSGLVATAQSLAVHRQSQGLQSIVVDLQDVYDEFNHGMVDLNAVRDFLQYAAANWQVPPRYVVLAGAGTYDYLDHLGLGDNLLPPFLRSDGETLFVSDTPFADFDGDGVAEIAIGRLPVVSSGELQTLIDKLAAYESLNEPEWGSHVVLASDNADVADFGATSDAYGDLLPNVAFQGTEVHLEDFASLAEARQALFDALDSGAVVLSYLGHGGVDRLAAEGLLTNADVPNLTNDGLPTVLLAVSCHIGFHGLPGFDSLGEHLVLDPTGGAAAVWAPSWLSRHSEAKAFGDRVFRQLFVEEERTLGDAVLKSLRNAATLGVDVSLLETYQLLGDPAMEVQLSPDYIPGGPPCEPNCSGG